jgi:hypothetical protein
MLTNGKATGKQDRSEDTAIGDSIDVGTVVSLITTKGNETSSTTDDRSDLYVKVKIVTSEDVIQQGITPPIFTSYTNVHDVTFQPTDDGQVGRSIESIVYRDRTKIQL